MEAQALEHERLLRKSQGEEALKHAIAAAELYMQAAGKAKAPEDRRRLRQRCAELIELGERLKAAAKASHATSRPPIPQSTRPLTTAEKTVILKASRLHGSVFPPWDAAPDAATFSSAGAPDGTYVDESPFSLSPEQQVMFEGWKRPVELGPEIKYEDLDRARQQLMTAEAEMDLAQDLATDCSVVAGLCAAARHLGPTADSLLAPLMYPFDYAAMRPQVSNNGKYIFRMYFNGSWRRVTIDDRLPASKNDRTLYVVDRRNPRLIWPALVEKAYLKIRGGYDFPGSNSGTDLHALTGWIPEQIFLQSDELDINDTWKRIKRAYDEWNVMLTLGTGNILPEEEKALGLVGEHDYAVVDLKQEDTSRLLLIKNPWIDSLVWTGVGSSATLKAHTVGSVSDGGSNRFWMAFEDVLQHFDSLYVNWNPALFAHRQDHHFRWDLPDKTEELVYTHNPQYSVTSPTGSPVWVLLSRHWQDGELDILHQRKAEKDRSDGSLANVSKQLGFMALAVYATSPAGSRVLLPDTHRRLHQGPYVDSPNTLLRYDPIPGAPHTLVVTQTELPLPSYSFTLSFFSSDPLAVSPAPEALPHSVSVAGAWTRRSAGGSAAHPSYFANPQYALTLSGASPLSLVLSTSARDLPVHAAVLFSPASTSSSSYSHSYSASSYPASSSSVSSSSSPSVSRHRVASISGRDVVCASAEYHRGCTSAAATRLEAGTYAVVVSTYEPGQTAPFALRVSAAAPLAIVPIPPDAAGRLRTPIPTLPGGNQRGESGNNPLAVSYVHPPFPPGVSRVRAAVHVARLTRLSAFARSVANNSTTAIPGLSGAGQPTATAVTVAVRVALELGTGPHRAVLAVSREGEFADAAMGLRTPEVDVEPDIARVRGGLWVVLERIGGGDSAAAAGGGANGRGGGGVHVEVLSDAVVQVAGWEGADED